MKQKHRSILSLSVAALVFVVQLYRGLVPPPPEPGMISSGALPASEPFLVCFPAFLSAFLAWVVLECLFRLLEKRKK